MNQLVLAVDLAPLLSADAMAALREKNLLSQPIEGLKLTDNGWSGVVRHRQKSARISFWEDKRYPGCISTRVSFDDWDLTASFSGMAMPIAQKPHELKARQNYERVLNQLLDS